MNEYVKQSIESRKLAFTSSYKLTDAYRKKVDDLFKKIEDFGKGCSDAMDFETKFAASPLNKEYTDLFSEVAVKCQPIIPEAKLDMNDPDDRKYLKNEVASEAKYVADEITMPLRRKAREEFGRKMRDTPLGKIEQASNTMSVFRRLFKK